jgi:hypothetical protein
MPAKLSRRLLLAALPAALAVLATPAGAQPCCGPITPDGQRLVQRLDASGVDHLWLPYKHVNWETGEIDIDPHARPAATHCSAFVASFQATRRLHPAAARAFAGLAGQRPDALAHN